MRQIESPLGTPKEVAGYLLTTEPALAQKRFKGTGPAFVRDGRRVLYKWADVRAYVDANTMMRTDDRPGAA